MSAITDTGFERTRLDDRFAALQDAARAIFGPSLNLDPDTIDGQTLGIFAEAISNLDQLAEDIYNGFSPQSSTGAAFSRLVQFNGIRRIAGAYSEVTVRCTGNQGTVIPAGSLIGSPSLTVTFQTTVAGTIADTGYIDIPARCTVMGEKLAPTGTLTKINSPLYGWQSVTNLADASPGRDEETDEALRIRRSASTSTPAQAVLDSIYGAIANIPQVKQARVFENDQDTTQPVTGLPPHSIYAVVDGGLDADIAKAIWLRKSSGATMVGSTSVAIHDSQGNPHTIKFGRPIDVDVYIAIDLTTRPGWPTDGVARIKTALLDWARDEQLIAEELILSRLYSPINSVPGFTVDSLFIGTAPSPTGTVNIPIAFDEIARLDSARITINVTTP